MKSVLLTCLFSILLIVLFILIKNQTRPSFSTDSLPPAPYTILDVRTDLEYDSGHYPGAKHIPLHELGTRYTELTDTPGTIVVYCRSGNRSEQAVHLLKKKGLTNTLNGINQSKLKTLSFLNKH